MKLVWKLTLFNAVVVFAAIFSVFVVLYKAYGRIIIRSQEYHMVSTVRSYMDRMGMSPHVRGPAVYRKYFVAIVKNDQTVVVNDPFGVFGYIKLEKGVQRIGDEYYLVVSVRRGEITYYVASNITPLMTALYSIKRFGIFVMFVGMSASFGIGFILSWFSLRPIRRVVEEIKEIGAKTLDKRLENPETGDELEELISEINSMLERLEKAYRSQERFVHDVSHELRNPLTSLKGFAKVLRKFGEDREIREEAVEEIEELVDDMSDLIENLLMLAKPDTSITPESVRVKNLVEEIVEKLLKSFPSREIRLDAVGDPVIETSPDLLRIIVKNLIENAMKYSPHDEPVVVRIGDRWIEVEDRGPGIPKEYRDKIFERFYRIDPSRDRRKSGYGLGLAMVKELCERLGMRVEFESEEGRGSVFRVVWD